MKRRTLLLLLASLIVFGLELETPLLAQAPATVVIVIDDTQVRPGDGPRVAELIDRLEQHVLDSRATFGIATVGPAGLNVDLTRDRRRLREASDAARAGRLDFTLPPNAAMAAAALVATMESVVSGVAALPGPKAVVVIGRAADVAEKRRPQWVSLRGKADVARIALAWVDLGGSSCRAGTSATDASLATGPAMCAPVSDASAISELLHAVARGSAR